MWMSITYQLKKHKKNEKRKKQPTENQNNSKYQNVS